jgi:LmbE family N-acetylglucosaminyl deacetylase
VPFSIVLTMALLATTGSAGAYEPSASLVVWGPAIGMADPTLGEARTGRLITVCRDLGVSRIHWMVDPGRQDPDGIRRFLRRTAAAGVDVYALTPGTLQQHWIAPFRKDGHADHVVVIGWIERVLNLEDLDSGARFAGLLLDIEPYHARPPGAWRRVWKTSSGGLLHPRNRAIALEYLALIDAVGARLGDDPSRPVLGVAIPTWWDGVDEHADFRIEVEGTSRTLAAHVQARVDFVAVMAYRDGADDDSRQRIVDDVRREIARGPTEVLLETARPGRDGPARHETVHHGGVRRLQELRDLLHDRFGNQDGFRGVGYHAYLDAVGAGTRRWPGPGQED